MWDAHQADRRCRQADQAPSPPRPVSRPNGHVRRLQIGGALTTNSQASSTPEKGSGLWRSSNSSRSDTCTCPTGSCPLLTVSRMFGLDCTIQQQPPAYSNSTAWTRECRTWCSIPLARKNFSKSWLNTPPRPEGLRSAVPEDVTEHQRSAKSLPRAYGRAVTTSRSSIGMSTCPVFSRTPLLDQRQIQRAGAMLPSGVAASGRTHQPSLCVLNGPSVDEFSGACARS